MALRISTSPRLLRSPVSVAVLLAVATTLSACGSVGQGGVTPQLSSESDCFAASDMNRCRLAHDKAGGYPITRGGGG